MTTDEHDRDESATANEPTGDELFDFPCDFPIKIMGQNSPTLGEHVETTVAQLGVEQIDLTERQSARGNYLALTLTVRATSRAQLDALYQALGRSDDVKALL